VDTSFCFRGEEMVDIYLLSFVMLHQSAHHVRYAYTKDKIQISKVTTTGQKGKWNRTAIFKMA
jgi:hypothetical protein